MGHTLSGRALLVDDDNAVMLGGGLALLSDGQSRSEIIITDPKSGREERLIFTVGTTWVPVYHLIQVIRELFDAESLEVHVSSDDDTPCAVCNGTGMYEDEDGNWRDCSQCVP